MSNKRGKPAGTMTAFYVIAALIFVGAFHKWLTYAALVAIFVIAAAIPLKNQRKSNPNIVTGIIFLLLVQNLCIGMGAHLAGNTDSSLQLLTQVPFMSVFLIWSIGTFLIHRRPAAPKVCFWFCLLILFIGISFVFSAGSMTSALVSVRNFTVFFMAYGIGVNYIDNAKGTCRVVDFIIRSGEVLTVLGVIIQAGGYRLYRAIGIHEVYIAKAAPFTEGQLDGRFYTSLFSNQSFVRCGSIMYEPVNLAYFFALAFLCALFFNSRSGFYTKVIRVVINGCGLWLTFGKGGYLIAAVALLCLCFECLMNSRSRVLSVSVKRKIMVGLIALFVAGFLVLYIKKIGLAVLNHVWAIERTWANVVKQPYGYGIGSGGNAAQRFGDVSREDWLATGGETALMSMMYQIGIQGVAAFVMCMIAISDAQREVKGEMGRIFVYLPYILIGVSLMQDNTFTPQCIVPYMLLQGSLYGMNIRKVRDSIVERSECAAAKTEKRIFSPAWHCRTQS